MKLHTTQHMRQFFIHGSIDVWWNSSSEYITSSGSTNNIKSRIDMLLNKKKRYIRLKWQLIIFND